MLVFGGLESGGGNCCCRSRRVWCQGIWVVMLVGGVVAVVVGLVVVVVEGVVGDVGARGADVVVVGC